MAKSKGKLKMTFSNIKERDKQLSFFQKGTYTIDKNNELAVWIK